MGRIGLAVFFLSLTFCAAEAKTAKEVCYPEALTEEEKKIGMSVPCAPANYIPMSMDVTQKDVGHDKSGIWKDEEFVGSTSVWIWEKTKTIGTKEVTISSALAGSICSMSDCPFRVRIREQGKPDQVMTGAETEQACASAKYYFIRDDLKEVIACDQHFLLKSTETEK